MEPYKTHDYHISIFMFIFFTKNGTERDGEIVENIVLNKSKYHLKWDIVIKRKSGERNQAKEK